MVKRVFMGISTGLLLLLVLDAIAVRTGIAPGAVPKVAGAAAWTTSRAAGVTAFLALTLDVVFGLFLSTGAADRIISRGTSVEIHRWLSSVALSMIAVHALALLLDPVVQLDALAIAVPFLAPYRPFAVALGVMATYGALVIYASFWLRRRIGAKTWRKLHFLSFFVFLSALVHALLAGSDSRTSGMQILYIASGASVSLLTMYRAFGARRPRGTADSPRMRRPLRG